MEKYTIALVRPLHSFVSITPPLGIGYLSSYLKKYSYDVLLIDALRDNLKEKDILHLLKKNNVNVLGITCISSFYKEVVDLSLFIKEHYNNIKVIIGGIHPTFLPYKTLVESKCDYVICGEGENAFKQLLDSNFDINTIRGVYTLNELKSKNDAFEKAVPVSNLDELPFPDWEQMPPNTYPVAPFGVFIKKIPVGIITSSRGCPYSCKFCASPNFYDHKIRFRSASNVVEEIKLLVEKYNVREIQFVDDNITMKRQHILDISELLLKNDINVAWSCPNGIRADKIDDALIKIMKKSGFYSCGLGIESSNTEILNDMNKKEQIDSINNAISILRKNKIEVCGFFIFGFPGETKETIKETIKYALKSRLTRANFGVLSVMPGCDLFKELDGKFVSDFSANIYRKPEYIPEGLTSDEIMKAQSTATKRFYLRIPILLNCMRYLRFSHFKSLLKRLKEYHIFEKWS